MRVDLKILRVMRVRRASLILSTELNISHLGKRKIILKRP